MNYSLYSKGTEGREDGHKPQLTQKSLQEPSLVLKGGKRASSMSLVLPGKIVWTLPSSPLLTGGDEQRQQ